MPKWNADEPSVREKLILLTQRQAAESLQVSQAYLRASACPKVMLPGNGPRGKPVIRYSEDDLRTWARERSARASSPQRRSA